MRNYFILFICIVGFASCKKTHCYNCTTVTDFGGASTPKVSTQEHCGWTEDEKQNYVQSNTRQDGNYSSRVTCAIK
tara:strand:+ start:209 stop:436 length:228 start_codon:yes stop_codon:yes gene_type:complete